MTTTELKALSDEKLAARIGVLAANGARSDAETLELARALLEEDRRRARESVPR